MVSRSPSERGCLSNGSISNKKISMGLQKPRSLVVLHQIDCDAKVASSIKLKRTVIESK